MGKHTVATIPDPREGGRPRRDDALAREHYQNERDWRRAGLSEKHDRTRIEKDSTLGMLAEIDRQHPQGRGGLGLEMYGGSLRPLPYRIFARKRDPYAAQKRLGIVIPDLMQRFAHSQRDGAFFDVLAVGAGVTSVRPGDCVVALAGVGRDLGASVGDDVYELWCDCEAVDVREYETETLRHPDGSRYQVQRRMSATERRVGGDVAAVLVEE